MSQSSTVLPVCHGNRRRPHPPISAPRRYVCPTHSCPWRRSSSLCRYHVWLACANDWRSACLVRWGHECARYVAASMSTEMCLDCSLHLHCHLHRRCYSLILTIEWLHTSATTITRHLGFQATKLSCNHPLRRCLPGLTSPWAETQRTQTYSVFLTAGAEFPWASYG